MTTDLAPVPSTVEPIGLASALLECFVRRDYDAMTPLLDPAVHFRALVPPRVWDGVGPGIVLERFQAWFGSKERFEVQDATVGRVGERPGLRWRVLADGTVVEQQLYLRCGETIEAIDLLCSGFQPAGGER